MRADVGSGTAAPQAKASAFGRHQSLAKSRRKGGVSLPHHVPLFLPYWKRWKRQLKDPPNSVRTPKVNESEGGFTGLSLPVPPAVRPNLRMTQLPQI